MSGLVGVGAALLACVVRAGMSKRMARGQRLGYAGQTNRAHSSVQPIELIERKPGESAREPPSPRSKQYQSVEFEKCKGESSAPRKPRPHSAPIGGSRRAVTPADLTGHRVAELLAY